jgi:LmbE family N-acetylglucosaminyl deacetylase
VTAPSSPGDHRPGGLLLAVPHPDDESFGAGGVAALAAARGMPVRIVLATDGAASEITDTSLDTPQARASLGTIRREEARCAGAALGAVEVAFLGFADGGLRRLGATALARALEPILARARPEVVVTFGPDGVYGHPDHVTMSAGVTAACGALDPPPERVFFMVIDAERAAQLNRDPGPVRLGRRDFPFRGYDAASITTTVDVSAALEAKLAALVCHRSQTAGRMASTLEWVRADPYERFVLHSARRPPPAEVAADLFAGL